MASQKGKCDQTREEEPIYVVELRTVLNVNSMRIESLMGRRLQWFGDLEKMRESAWSSKCRTFNVSGSYPRGRPSKTWNEVIRNDMKQSKTFKRKKCLEVFRKSISC